jgi:hypothetical protein
MDVDELVAAVCEAGRVLEPGGRLCARVTHPLAGQAADQLEGRA